MDPDIDDRKEVISTGTAAAGEYQASMGWAKVLLWGLVALAGAGADLDVMKDVTLGFGAALESCRGESGLTEDKMEQFFHLWDEGFNFEARELGCAMFCMSRYFNLVTDANRLHHDNTEKFIKTFPNGEKLAKELVALIHQCEKQFYQEQDNCWRILRIAECFTAQCRAQGLAPTMEMLLAEFIMQAER